MAKVKIGAKKSARLSVKAAATVTEHKPNSFDGFIGRGGDLLAVLEAMGLSYNPANTNITKAKITLKQAELSTLVSNVKTSADIEKQNIIDYNEGYVFMAAYTTDSLNAFRGSEGILAAQVKIAENGAKKVRGTRINPIGKIVPIIEVIPIVEEAIDESDDSILDKIRHNSVSFQKFDVRLGNFFTYINYIASVTNYKTNETRLKAPALLAYYESLKVLRSDMKNSSATTNELRSDRNEGFFNNTTGARFLYSQVKSTIASTKGLTGANYRKVKGLSFANLIEKAKRTPTTNY